MILLIILGEKAMRIRKLELKDAPLMLEWMHDESAVCGLRGSFKEKTLDDCIAFINNAHMTEENIHLAIATDADEYMGTVSLKDIDRKEQSAEFAITVRKSAMGKGYSWYGMREIIQKAFEEYGLNRVYWCVSAQNVRAVKFYNKHGFERISDISEKVQARYKDMNDLLWYEVQKNPAK